MGPGDGLPSLFICLQRNPGQTSGDRAGLLQASPSISDSEHGVRLAPEPWPPGSQDAAGDSAEGQGDRCPALVLKLPLEVTGATGVHNYWPKTGACPEDSWV